MHFEAREHSWRRWGTQLLGMLLVLVSAFFLHAIHTKIPVGQFSLSTSTWLSWICLLIAASLVAWCVIMVQQCRRLKTRSGLLYVVAPVCLFLFVAWRALFG
jgi:predicted membrane channel-forming protein YqfA (hemolysin III family)